jgi:hypothetical protein
MTKTSTDNRGSIIRWTATDLGIQIKIFVYDQADRFVCATELEIGSARLREMTKEHLGRLDQLDEVLPPWQ